MPPLDDATLRAYLLGQLPEDQVEAVEEAYFADDNVLAAVRAADDDLLDDFAAGRLSPAERQAFEDRPETPTRRDRVRVARALRRLAAAPADAGDARFGPPLRSTLLLLAAVVLLSLFAVRIWSPSDVQVPTPVAQVETPVPVASAPVIAETQPARVTPITFVVALAPLLTRGEALPPQVRIPAHASEVLLEFQGEPDSLAAHTRWRASLASVEGHESWHGPAEPARDPTRKTLLATARLPSRALPPDDYVATLAPVGDTFDAAPFRYFFRVVE